MIDILLVNPATIAEHNNPIPFGIAYLASFLEKHDFSVKILDLSINHINDQEILEYIKKINPKNIGFSCMSVHAEFIKNISKKIKALFPDIRLIVGGIHPTSLLKKSIDEFEYVDIFVIGEGEITLLEILKNYKKEKIKGIAFKKGKKVITNLQREFIQNLDELPFPARNMLPSLENYKLGFDWEGRTPATTIFTSRGCPFNCIYCASKVMWKRKVRFRSAENVLKEIDFLVKKYKIREILFYDDHFTLNKKRLLEICEGLIKRKYDLTWCCLSRVDSIDFETAEVMKRAGCHMISFGVESGSQKILDVMNKNVKVNTIIKAFKTCRKVGINTKASFIFGAPKESYETIKETQDLLKIILPDYIWIFIMTPLPGTKLYKLHQEANIASDEWSLYDQTTYNKFYDTNLTYDDFRKLVSKTYKSYYLSFKYILSQIIKFNIRKIKVYLTAIKKLRFIINYIKKGRKKEESS